ncbi:MAG: hypothetical protein AUI12_12540 [Acidobacteria bacterium 13_2_20CM_2_57_6]|nr:MAG: hypothetical protein AUI12_12540 [Acidobacteria bacterium 13_2_20CM_2_57_6]PYT46989.1 MAG: hypothetical protein DMG47_02930 [Acidobacteriota bacterium]
MRPGNGSFETCKRLQMGDLRELRLAVTSERIEGMTTKEMTADAEARSGRAFTHSTWRPPYSI